MATSRTTSTKNTTECKKKKPEKKSISIASRKAKGRKLQQWVAKEISNLLNIPFGKDCLISSREMGQSGTDVRLIGVAQEKFPFSVECKAQETWSIGAFIEQAKANQKKETDWLLFVKRKRENIVVMMDAERFFKLLERIGYGKDY